MQRQTLPLRGCDTPHSESPVRILAGGKYTLIHTHYPYKFYYEVFTFYSTVLYASFTVTVCQFENFGGITGFPAKAFGPGSDIEKYILAALVVPKS